MKEKSRNEKEIERCGSAEKGVWKIAEETEEVDTKRRWKEKTEKNTQTLHTQFTIWKLCMKSGGKFI